MADELLGHLAAGKGDRLTAELFGKPQRRGDRITLGFAKVDRAAGLDIDGRPGRAQARRHAGGVAHQRGRARVMIDRDEDAFARRPGAGDGMRLHMGQQLVVDALGGLAQRQFPQCR